MGADRGRYIRYGISRCTTMDQDEALRRGLTRLRVSVMTGSSLLTFSFTIADPTAQRRVLDDDRLRAFGAGGNKTDLHADLFR